MSPDFFKPYVSSLLKGVLFGIGFIAVMISGSHYIAHVVRLPLKVSVGEKPANSGDDQSAAGYKHDLVIVSYISYKERKTAGHFNILGKIKNIGTVTWHGIELQAELFNDGQYVDECQGHVPILHPGEEDNFKIQCGECNEREPSPHDKIALKIAAAYRETN